MPRLVRLTETRPLKIEPTDKAVFVCACGLSQKYPLCDGSHKSCVPNEPDPESLYVYDHDRRTIIEVRREEPAGGTPPAPFAQA